MKIPFYARYAAGRDQEALISCLEGTLATDGVFSEKVLEQLGWQYPDNPGMLTSSCSVALETALALCGLKAGDEVLLPSYNFPSAANGVLRAGGVPVFCDIDCDTQNLSIQDAAAKITSRTKAVIPVHYAGISCPMDELLKLAKEAELLVIEDAAQAIGAFYKEDSLGTLGDFGCVSFHYTKNITCGEGGLLLCKTQESYEKARCYRVHGTNRDAFFRGECDRYTWVCPGSSTAPSELCAALLWASLPYLDEITRIRMERVREYLEVLESMEKHGYARRMVIPDYARPNGHIFYLRFANKALREKVQTLLLEHGAEAKTHYVPLHLSPMGKKLGYQKEDCPESGKCYDTLLRLPLHTELTFLEVEQIGEIITKGCVS